MDSRVLPPTVHTEVAPIVHRNNLKSSVSPMPKRSRSPAWPRQDIMDAIQQAQVFADSKHFVYALDSVLVSFRKKCQRLTRVGPVHCRDMPLRHNHGVAVDHFSQLHAMNHSTESLSRYIAVHHWEPGRCGPP
jgi:hypothetical protein